MLNNTNKERRKHPDRALKAFQAKSSIKDRSQCDSLKKTSNSYKNHPVSEQELKIQKAQYISSLRDNEEI